MDQEAQRVLTTGPMITFRGARKLSSFLVRAKLYPLERTVASCDKRCERLTSTVKQNTCKINHQFNCSKKPLFIYLHAINALNNMFGKP